MTDYRGPDRAARVCVVVGLLALLAFAGWQLVMPEGFVSVRGLNLRAVLEWRTRFGFRVPVVSLAAYTRLFRTWIVLSWAAYAGLVWAMIWGARLGPRWTWRLSVPVVVVVAVAMPAGLSTDVFAYLGYARLAVVHGLNPHLHTQVELARLGDPTAAYLSWPIASPYGPLWTLISMVVVWATPTGSVLGAVIVLKLIAGAAVLVAAAATRAIVRGFAPDRADATFVAVAMNPLLLVEGPGSGHNDVVMVALLMAGFAMLARGRPRWAALAIGAAAAIKLVPLVVLPWLAILAARSARPRWSARVRAFAVMALIGMAPVVATYAPFWSGARTLGGIAARWQHADRADGRGSDTPETVSSIVNREVARQLLARTWPALLVYAWAALAVAFGRGNALFRIATVWSFAALAIMLFVAGLWFPWYLAWVWPAILVRFTRAHLALIAFVLPFSMLLMLVYALSPG